MRITFLEWVWCKVSGRCVKCGGTRDQRGFQPKFVAGTIRSVPCQDPFHGERNFLPGEQCFDPQGNPVIMPD